MILSKKTIVWIIGLTAFALLGLMIIQVFWLREGVKLYQAQMANRISLLNEQVTETIKQDEQLMEEITTITNKGLFPELFSHNQTLAETESRITNHLNQSLRSHELDLDFDLAAMVSEEGICWFPTRAATQSKILSACSNDRLCFSPLQEAGSFNLGLRYHPDCTLISKDLLGLGATTLIFILILVGTFGYTILLVHRQKKLSALKTDFINNLTHEFKTPIFSINLGASMIKKALPKDANDKLGSYVDLIIKENHRLRNQVDKILQIGVIDSGMAVMNKEVLDVHDLIHQSAQRFQPLLAEKSGQLCLDLQAKHPLIYGDELCLADALNNLLDNAYKYSPDSPQIVVATEDVEDGVCIRIQDQGIGMSPEVIRQMYQKFYRAHAGDVHDVKGFGLGLSYVKRILDLHRGSITCSSRLGQGSEFVLIIPTA